MPIRSILSAAAILALLVPVLHGQQPTADVPVALGKAEADVSPDRIREADRFLSSDLFEGRYPGLRGGELAAEYIADQFALAGLQPAGDHGG